jgi:hypothetical protein
MQTETAKGGFDCLEINDKERGLPPQREPDLHFGAIPQLGQSLTTHGIRKIQTLD